MEWYFGDCIALKKEFPHLIAGRVLRVYYRRSLSVSQVSILSVTRIHWNRSFTMRRLCYASASDKSKRALIYLSFSTLERRLEMGRRRIWISTMLFCLEPSASVMGWFLNLGHYQRDEVFWNRYSLIKHPKLVEICRQRQIAVEVCPISCVLCFIFYFLHTLTGLEMRFWYDECHVMIGALKAWNSDWPHRCRCILYPRWWILAFLLRCVPTIQRCLGIWDWPMTISRRVFHVYGVNPLSEYGTRCLLPASLLDWVPLVF